MNSIAHSENSNKILIADDDEIFRDWVGEYLGRLGYDCVRVDNAASAMETLNKESYHLLIADINMPGNHELELLHGLQNRQAKIPVILVTGYPTIDSAVKSVNLPVLAYLVKPFKPEELLAQVKTAIARSTVMASIERTKARLSAWQDDLSSVEDLIKIKPDAYSNSVPIETFITLTIQNILEPLFDLKNLTETLYHRNDEAPENVCNLFNCPRLEAHAQMIDHSIEVLEHTKNSFKSKEVGELRKKLERFLHVMEES